MAVFEAARGYQICVCKGEDNGVLSSDACDSDVRSFRWCIR